MEVRTACEEGNKVILDLAFTAIDSSRYVRLDSIRVMNRTMGGDTLIQWPDTTLTMEIISGDHLLYIGYASRYPYGFEELLPEQGQFAILGNYPNPVTDQGNFSVFIPEKGNLELRVTDAWGRNLYNSAMVLEKGINSFRFTPGPGNLFLISAHWNGVNRSIKVLSASPGSGRRCALEYTGSQTGDVKSDPRVMSTELITQESGILEVPDAGRTVTFQFATNIPCHGMQTVEYGGQVYKTIQIFSQCWMKENMNVGKMILHDSLMSNNGIIEKYCYEDREDSCLKYGGLYYWDEMMQYSFQQGAQGICPPSWHVPTDEDWKVLEGAADSEYGIGSPECDMEWESRGLDAGTNLRSSTGWSGGNNGSNLYGFAALAAGSYLSYWLFDKVGQYSHLWTSTKDDPEYAKYRYLDYTDPGIYRRHSGLDYEISVRCVRNN